MISIATEYVESFVWWILGVLALAVGWVGRNILTNGKRLDLLEQNGKHQSVLRQQDHEAIKEVRDDLRDIKSHLMGRSK